MVSKLGFIGFGKMANAICKGVIYSGFMNKENVFAYDINKESLNKNASEIGINPICSAEKLVNDCDVILIATKPFVVNEVLSQIKDIANDKLIISIAAGIIIETYQSALKRARIVRVMPNTPAMVNEGMSVVCGGTNASKEDVEFVYQMFSRLGKAEIMNEDKINAVTAVSGSGPAFYYYFIDKIAKGGVEVGLNYESALKLSAQTALGAAKMILESGKTPEELITAVTTPNGTTAEGNKVLNESDVESVILEMVEKTYKRAIELGLKK